MSFDAVARKREHYQEAGERDCPTCKTPQKCWRSTADIHSVLICQRCQTAWLDPIESEKARQAMWDREEMELRKATPPANRGRRRNR